MNSGNSSSKYVDVFGACVCVSRRAARLLNVHICQSPDFTVDLGLLASTDKLAI